MKIPEAVMAAAKERGLQHFFGIPGGGSPLDLIEAGRKHEVRFVHVAHESSAGIAAACYGLLKHTAGLAMGIRGVGAGNLAGGVANAHFDRLPLVAICESVAASARGKESVQQCDQEQLFAGIANFQATLTPTQASKSIRSAFFHATDGRPGASVLHLPADAGDVEDDEDSSGDVPSKSSTIDEVNIEKVKEFIAKNHRLVILAGADVARGEATGELLSLAEDLGAAVLVTMEARGVFPETHPRWGGVFLGFFNPNVIESKFFQKADGILMVGVDAMMTHAPWTLSQPTCELVARPEYTTMSSPVARVNDDLKTLMHRLSGSPKPGFSEAEIQSLRADVDKYFKRPPHARFAAQDVIQITREILPADGLLISETGAFICMLEHLWPVDRWGTYLGTSGGRTMGLTIPATLGARLADPQRPMVGIGADGSLLMRLGELETFARTGAAVPLVIINDQALGTIKSRQQARGFPDYGLDLHPVDFAAIARACGLYGVTVKTPEAFRSELVRATKADRTTLIDARVDPKAYQDSFGPTIGVLRQPLP